MLIDALIRAEKENNIIYDIVIMLQPTSPLRTVENVENALAKLISDQFSSVWSISETDTKAHPLKQLVIEGANLNYYDEKGSKIVARQSWRQHSTETELSTFLHVTVFLSIITRWVHLVIYIN